MKKLSTLLLALCAALSLTVTAWADYDYIDRYAIDVTPNVDDGSLHITVELTWTALEALPYGQELKIGLPNGSIREETALTDNIERLAHDNSYMYVYLNRGYDDGETFDFSYSWVQEYMYTLTDSGTVYYDYTPGWFDEAGMGEMMLSWHDPEGVTGRLTIDDGSASAVFQDGEAWAMQTDRGYGYTMHLTAEYPEWPVALYSDYSADNLPDDYGDGWDAWYGDDYDRDAVYADVIVSIVTFAVLMLVIIIVVARLSRRSYRGGFGTRYVFVDHLWYPAGPDGRPRPGSVGVKERPRPPKPPHDSGFGGGSRGGGFGGGGFGGGSHCACASSCACACACACAGGGRAGCSAKNIYRVTVKAEERE